MKFSLRLILLLALFSLGFLAGLFLLKPMGLLLSGLGALFGVGVLVALLLIRPMPRETLKILDTSAIIDGRIAEVCEVGFLEGILIVPRFIMRELQYIADSPDPVRRARGRRGLEILKKIQEEKKNEVLIDDTEIPDIREIDAKLLKLAEQKGAQIITTDYNLNRVAGLHGVKVLNINDLVNSVKPIFLPGEEFKVYLVKRGKNEDQAVGYLEDGTMVVVDEGGASIGRTITVAVTGMHQTSAGKMVFAKPKVTRLIRRTPSQTYEEEE
ncbi:MAG: PIN domain-containing protein [Candidatus Edwardsbacteria bacterium]